jgi:hypothetical protein
MFKNETGKKNMSLKTEKKNMNSSKSPKSGLISQIRNPLNSYANQKQYHEESIACLYLNN